MSLKDPIKFRYLLNQLTNEEMTTFLLLLVNKSRDVIIASLFGHFVDSPQEAKHFNDIISKIIRKRKPKSISLDKPINKHKLDTIPSHLIGHTASYAEQQDYVNLSLVNRSVYLGCNSPNMLQEINLSVSSITCSHYSTIDLEC